MAKLKRANPYESAEEAGPTGGAPLSIPGPPLSIPSPAPPTAPSEAPAPPVEPAGRAPRAPRPTRPKAAAARGGGEATRTVRRLAIDVTANLWLRFRARAVAQGSDGANMLRELIRQAVEETEG